VAELHEAAVAVWAAALPENGQLFTLGDNHLFAATISVSARGTRSGSAASNGACRLLRNLDCGCCGHALTLNQVAVAPFYDVGAAYLDGHILGSTAHALAWACGWTSVCEFSGALDAAVRHRPHGQRLDAVAILAWHPTSLLTDSHLAVSSLAPL